MSSPGIECGIEWAPAGTFWALFAALVAIFPGLLDGQLLNDAGLPRDVTRLRYTTTAAVAIGIATLAGFVFYWLGSTLEGTRILLPVCSPHPSSAWNRRSTFLGSHAR